MKCSCHKASDFKIGDRVKAIYDNRSWNQKYIGIVGRVVSITHVDNVARLIEIDSKLFGDYFVNVVYDNQSFDEVSWYPARLEKVKG